MTYVRLQHREIHTCIHMLSLSILGISPYFRKTCQSSENGGAQYCLRTSTWMGVVFFYFRYEYTPQPQYELNMHNSYNHFSLFIQARQKVRTLHGGGQTNGGWTTSTSLQTEAKERSEYRFQ